MPLRESRKPRERSTTPKSRHAKPRKKERL